MIKIQQVFTFHDRLISGLIGKKGTVLQFLQSVAVVVLEIYGTSSAGSS